MISVFGSTGFIGSRFCELYPDDVIKINRDSYIPSPESNDILYMISTTDNYNVFSNPLLDIETNLSVLIKILQNVNRNTTFNFVSSWFCYGDTDLPAKEDSVCNPKGFYSITKRTAEQLLISYCNTFGINYRIFRLANVIGKNDKGVSKKKNALQYLINELKANRDVGLYYDGKFIRDYIYVDDVCQAIKFCIDYAPLGKDDIINIGSGIPFIFRDLMDYCKNKIKSTSNFIDIEPTSFHKIVQVKDMYLDITKLKSIGFQKSFNIYEALDKLI